MKYDLTIRKIKNTKFSELYDKFIVGEKLNNKQYRSLLAIAICFLNAENLYVQQFGYRIIVDYCNQTKNYAPLYEIAINKGLYPVSKFIQNQHIGEEVGNFFTEWNDAFTQNYVHNEICLSEQQFEINDLFLKNSQKNLSVIAPTSYGKSELILSVIKQFAGKKVCIITSTKALLMQTKKRVQKIGKENYSKLIVHPEMYNTNCTSLLAILTQERLLRLFKRDSDLCFDCIIVDEAHEMLEKNSRSKTLANAIIIAQKRNPNIVFKFLTPFLNDENNLKVRYTSYDLEGYKVSEYIKTEKYYLYDLRNGNGLNFYDQFLDKFINIQKGEKIHLEEEKVVEKFSSGKNIIYLNRPADIEKFALSLAKILPDIKSDVIDEACKNISNYLNPKYNLLTCLRKGIIYHHGSVPDSIRIFIEDLYKQDGNIRYVVSSSTLLSGVNLPAEKMFILDNRKGTGNLRYEAFRNLIGRICRFSDIFDKRFGSLNRLEPEIYLVFGKYFSSKANCYKFLSDVSKVEKEYEDSLKNILLSNTEINAGNEEEFVQATEFIENYEKGVVKEYQQRYTKTKVGQACVMNGINEIDVFAHEESIQAKLESLYKEKLIIKNTNDLLNTIYELFFLYLPDNKNENLKRFEYEQTRKFYSMMLDWRGDNKSYSEMISLFVGYWKNLLKKDQNAMIYVGKWGDETRNNGLIKHYTRLSNKSLTGIINLAIVRIKEEQDFIDNLLIKYIEVLQDVGLLDNCFYNQIKYGTDDKEVICLLKNGLSLSSAVLLIKKYKQYIHINIKESTVIYDQDLLLEMEKSHENKIIIYEIENCI